MLIRPPHRYHRVASLIWILVGFMACAPSSYSQTAQAAQADNQVESDPLELEPVIELPAYIVEGYDESRYGSTVSETATGFETEHDELPLLVNVVSDFLLREQQALSIEETVRNISGVDVKSTSSGQANQVSIRGFNSFTFIDGFRVGNSNSSSLGGVSYPIDLASVERIEVLKGPAATLYGRGLPGGVINFITKKPSLQPASSVEALFGSDGLYRFIGDTTGPVAEQENLAYRLIATRTASESYRDSIDQKAFRIYPSLAWSPSERTSLLLSTEFSKINYTPDQGVVFLPNGKLANASSRAAYFGSSSDSLEAEQFGIYLRLDQEITDQYSVKAQVGARYAEENGTATLGTNLVGNSLERVITRIEDERQDYLLQLDQLFRFEQSAFRNIDLSHQILLSTNWQQINTTPIRVEQPTATLVLTTENPIAIDPGIAGNPPQNFDLSSTEFGIGLQDLIQIGDELHLLLAARYDYAKLDFDLSPSPFIGELDKEEVSYRSGILYRINPNLFIFANYGTAFRPTFRTNNLGQSLYDVQKSIQYEIGFKLVSANRSLTLNAAIYHLTNQDVVIQDSLGNLTKSDQIAYGAEVDLSAKINPSTTLLFNYSYTNTQYTSGPFENNHLFGCPEHTVGIWIHQNLIDEAAHRFSINVGLNYHSYSYATDANFVQLPEAYKLSAGLQYQRKAWTLRAQAYNLLNELDYVPSTNRSIGSLTAPIFATPTSPLGYRLSLKYSF